MNTEPLKPNKPSAIHPWICATCLAVFAVLWIGWADSLEGIKEKTGNIQTVSAAFIQEKHLPILARPLVSKGAFHYKRPDALRWEYKTPVKSILLMHKGEAKQYMETGNGFAEDSGQGALAMQFVLPEIAAWLSGRFDESPMFEARLETGQKIILTPRDKGFSKMIQHIELMFSRQPGVIDTVSIFENDDSFTRIDFQNTKINQPIADSVFKGIK